MIASCDALHDNPLDPDNPDNKMFCIEGYVVTVKYSPSPIDKVKVFWGNENVEVLTDELGYFKINCDNTKDGWLCFEKQGFTKDSVYVEWKGKKRNQISERMNASPTLDSIRIYSIAPNVSGAPEYQLVFEINAYDADNDIDSIIAVCPELQIHIQIPKISARFFEGKFSDYNLDLSEFNDLIGKTFSIYAVTDENKRYFIGSSNVKRIIESKIVTLSPQNYDTVHTNYPILKWTRFKPGFTFRYRAEIYAKNGWNDPVLLWYNDNISSDSISVKVDKPITPTPYYTDFYWVIWCIDEYNDRSCSQSNSFSIGN